MFLKANPIVQILKSGEIKPITESYNMFKIAKYEREI